MTGMGRGEHIVLGVCVIAMTVVMVLRLTDGLSDDASGGIFMGIVVVGTVIGASVAPREAPVRRERRRR